MTTSTLKSETVICPKAGTMATPRSTAIFPPRKILFAVDASERSRAAAHVVRELARPANAEITLLHTVEAGPHSAFEQTMDEARKKLDGLIKEDLAGCNLVVHLTTGSTAAAITHLARTWEADVIVMATHGHGNFVRGLVGSLTARVLHEAPCPVWTSAHIETDRAFDAGLIRTILCAVDLGSRSTQVLEAAVNAARFWKAGLRLLHVAEVADESGAGREKLIAAVEDQLRALAQGPDGEAIVEVVNGSPVKEVIHAAERCEANLIVVGRTEVMETEEQLGSTAYGIIAAAHCPVLSV